MQEFSFIDENYRLSYLLVELDDELKTYGKTGVAQFINKNVTRHPDN